MHFVFFYLVFTIGLLGRKVESLNCLKDQTSSSMRRSFDPYQLNGTCQGPQFKIHADPELDYESVEEHFFKRRKRSYHQEEGGETFLELEAREDLGFIKIMDSYYQGVPGYMGAVNVEEIFPGLHSRRPDIPKEEIKSQAKELSSQCGIVMANPGKQIDLSLCDDEKFVQKKRKEIAEQCSRPSYDVKLKRNCEALNNALQEAGVDIKQWEDPSPEKVYVSKDFPPFSNENSDLPSLDENKDEYNWDHRSERIEYRELKDKERIAFHDAVEALKTETIDGTSKYDLFISQYNQHSSPSANGGPASLPFHREFLNQFEIALRLVDPEVALPYWDSALDQYLPDPKDSIIWSDEFLGNGDGEVVTGPFAYWKTKKFVETLEGHTNSLYRSVGSQRQASLVRISAVDHILRAEKYDDLTFCVDSFFENMRMGVFGFVGGHMQMYQDSPNDPVFFLHQAYLDHVWEDFREKQQSPSQRESQWPPPHLSCTEKHNPNATMEPFEIKNIDGLSLDYTEHYYHYHPSPHCNGIEKNCNTPYLFCDTRRRTPRCLSKIRIGGNCTGLQGFDSCLHGNCSSKGLCIDPTATTEAVPETTMATTEEDKTLKEETSTLSYSIEMVPTTRDSPSYRPMPTSTFSRTSKPTTPTTESAEPSTKVYEKPAKTTVPTEKTSSSSAVLTTSKATQKMASTKGPQSSYQPPLDSTRTSPQPPALRPTEAPYRASTAAPSMPPVLPPGPPAGPGPHIKLYESIPLPPQQIGFPTVYFTVTVIKVTTPVSGEWYGNQSVPASGATIQSIGANVPTGYDETMDGVVLSPTDLYYYPGAGTVAVFDPEEAGYYNPMIEARVIVRDANQMPCRPFRYDAMLKGYVPSSENVRLSRRQLYADPIPFQNEQQDALRSRYENPDQPDYLLFKCQ